MKFKRVIFWSHLSAGVLTGAVVFLLSLSGVVLMYERQMIAAAETSFYVEPESGQTMLSADELAARATEQIGEGISLVFLPDEGAPVAVEQGRSGYWLMNPYTGEIMGEGATGLRGFFDWVTDFHRRFALEGDSGHTIIAASNLIFLFIILSGIYLWLPKIWKWTIVKKNIFFGRNLPSSKARDYNWHHVFAIWALIPLFFIITTGLVFSYDWANRAVFAAFGEEPPKSRFGPPPRFDVQADPANLLSLQAALDIARDYDSNWNRIELSVDGADNPVAGLTVDTGTGGQPTKQTDLYISRADGSILRASSFSDATPGRQARGYIRFLHTGESLGFWGQTLFGLASLAACFLVYTGLALAYRRLLQPVIRGKKAAN